MNLTVKKSQTTETGNHIARLLPSKYFKEPRREKAEKLGAQQIICWALLQEL